MERETHFKCTQHNLMSWGLGGLNRKEKESWVPHSTLSASSWNCHVTHCLLLQPSWLPYWALNRVRAWKKVRNKVLLDGRHLCPWEAEIWLLLWASQVSYDPSSCSLPQLVASTPPMAVLQSTITGLQMTLATGRLVCIFFLILLSHDSFSKYTYLLVYLFIYMTCVVVHTCALRRSENDLSSVMPARLHLLNFLKQYYQLGPKVL